MDNGKKAVLPYNRVKAVEYAHKWLLGEIRNILILTNLAAIVRILHHRFCLPEAM